ncbi:MAG: thioredoxin [Clostridia bacterium]|nr:thioredoxin [Clostridia bacterium]
MLYHVESKEQFEELLNKPAVLVDFYADWCMPCKMQSPIVEELAEEGYEVAKVNVDELSELALRYNVRSIPMMIYFVNGAVKEQVVGLTSKEELAALMQA